MSAPSRQLAKIRVTPHNLPQVRDLWGEIMVHGKALFAACLLALTACTGALAKQGAGNGTETSDTLAAPDLSPEISRVQVDAPQRILFVGNSYFFYNDSLHNHVKRMVEAAGLAGPDDLTYKSSTIGGAALRDHAIDHLLDPASLRVDAPFEIVIMQGHSSAGLGEKNRKRFRDTALDYAAKVRAAGGEPVFYMTPAYVAPHRRARPDMIDDVASLYIETANAADALVIPVGLAFEEAYRRKPDVVLHKQFDGSHPSLLGTYLAAATVYASLYRTSPVGNAYDYFGAVSREDALFLQQVAQDTVTQFYGAERAR